MKWARIRFLFAGFLKVRILGWAIRSLQLVGAEQVGLEDCLQLRFFSLLGRRKEILHIKRDSVIFEEVRLNGSWGYLKSNFFRLELPLALHC
jgi:hypothetical protein